MSTLPFTEEERIILFWSKVNKTNTCWLWAGAYDKSRNAGAITWGQLPCRGKNKFRSNTQAAHRVSWYLTYKEWPKVPLKHICENNICVNPNHLCLLGDSRIPKKQKEKELKPYRCHKLSEEEKLKVLHALKVGQTRKKASELLNLSLTTLAIRIKQYKIIYTRWVESKVPTYEKWITEEQLPVLQALPVRIKPLKVKNSKAKIKFTESALSKAMRTMRKAGLLESEILKLFKGE